MQGNACCKLVRLNIFYGRTGKCEKVWRGHKGPILDFEISRFRKNYLNKFQFFFFFLEMETQL